ncbi:eCIS core domain-containing protein [Methylotetracoccus oryzae]|uniref:eCIS core domain-containing protein n=1 Tax=Methylotetracoccus oryzae TaxID=1919059 RepID=UPI0011182FF0|nr:DUF4157 domain-containing protein [Methylotetracoccus oryzae]
MRFIHSRSSIERNSLSAKPERVPAGQPRYLRGSHLPLPETVRQALEEASGVDLSQVRLHADGPADERTRKHDAVALTSGQDIYFRQGAGELDTEAGRHLLLHELTHVLQQNGGVPFASDTDLENLEFEADRESERWQRGERPQVSAAPRGVSQCQPAGSGGPAKPVTAAQAAALQPPLYTDYFDEVIPGVLEAVEQNGELPPDHALWLLIQSYGEQSPLSVNKDKSVNYYLPSKHHNRLFNEHARVTTDPVTHKKTVVPGQERPGISIYNLPQKEFIDGQWVTASSPTFGYDSPARSTAHHLELLKEHRTGVWNALKNGKSFEGFVDALHSSGYATEPAYVVKLKSLQNQVRLEVTRWLAFRLPELRKRVERMVAYCEFLEEQRAMWARRLREEADPVGANARESARIEALAIDMRRELDQRRADLARLERFSASLKPRPPSP